MSNKTFDTIEAIAASVSAYEFNGNRYIKLTEYTENGKIWANRDILRAYFDIDYYSVNDLSDRPPLLSLTETQRETAKKIKEYTKKNLFKAISFNPSKDGFPPYDISMFQKLNQETITVSDFGFIASAPHYYEINTNKDIIKELIDTSNSKHVGTIGGNVILDNFMVLRCMQSKNYEGFVVSGICDNNLFLFYTNHDLKNIRTFDFLPIKGKVKDHIIEQDKYQYTKLNYVSLRK